MEVLWSEVGSWLDTLDVKIPSNKKLLLFGCVDQSVSSVSNYIILTVKYYIWVSRLNNNPLNVAGYKRFLYFKLEELKNAYIYEKKDHVFNQFLVIFNSLSD